MNVNLGKTKITDKIWVSSAAIWREEFYGSYFLVETWIFSDDPTQENRHIIHGTHHGKAIPSDSELFKRCQKIHGYIARNLQAKYGMLQKERK